MLSEPLDVVCLGILVVDVIARPVEGLPARGTLELVDEISMRGGGSALNTASALVRLGLHAGAAGYWMKNGSARELLRAVETVAAGEIYASPAIAALAMERFARRKNLPHGMEMLSDRAQIVAIDLVEVNPVLDTQNMTGILAAELAQSLLGKRIL